MFESLTSKTESLEQLFTVWVDPPKHQVRADSDVVKDWRDASYPGASAIICEEPFCCNKHQADGYRLHNSRIA